MLKHGAEYGRARWKQRSSCVRHTVCIRKWMNKWRDAPASTCQDGFVGLELLSGHTQRTVREAGVLPQAPQLIRQPAVGHLHHVHGVLPGYVDRVLHHAHLGGERSWMQ